MLEDSKMPRGSRKLLNCHPDSQIQWHENHLGNFIGNFLSKFWTLHDIGSTTLKVVFTDILFNSTIGRIFCSYWIATLYSADIAHGLIWAFIANLSTDQARRAPWAWAPPPSSSLPLRNWRTFAHLLTWRRWRKNFLSGRRSREGVRSTHEEGGEGRDRGKGRSVTLSGFGGRGKQEGNWDMAPSAGGNLPRHQW